MVKPRDGGGGALQLFYPARYKAQPVSHYARPDLKAVRVQIKAFKRDNKGTFGTFQCDSPSIVLDLLYLFIQNTEQSLRLLASHLFEL
jgi:hypothetical protein